LSSILDKFKKPKKLTGGHETGSGHRIGMTDDQMTHFRELLSSAVRDITTDPAFTPKQKKDLIKQMPAMSDKNQNFYDFLNSQYRSGPDVSKFVAIMERKETARTRGRRKAIR